MPWRSKNYKDGDRHDEMLRDGESIIGDERTLCVSRKELGRSKIRRSLERITISQTTHVGGIHDIMRPKKKLLWSGRKYLTTAPRKITEATETRDPFIGTHRKKLFQNKNLHMLAKRTRIRPCNKLGTWMPRRERDSRALETTYSKMKTNDSCEYQEDITH